MLVRPVLNSQPQVIHPPWPPKCLDYRREPPHPATKLHILILALQCIHSDTLGISLTFHILVFYRETAVVLTTNFTEMTAITNDRHLGFRLNGS